MIEVGGGALVAYDSDFDFDRRSDDREHGTFVDPSSLGLVKLGVSPIAVERDDDDSSFTEEDLIFIDDALVMSRPSKFSRAIEIYDLRQFRNQAERPDENRKEIIDALFELSRYAIPAITGALGAVSMFFTVIFLSAGVVSLGIVGVFGSTTFLLISVVSFRLQRQIDRREWRQRNQEFIYR